MEAGGGRSPWLLLLALVLVRQGHFDGWPGFQEKPMSQENVNSTLNFFIQSYNNASNDTYLFRVQNLLRTQVQLTTGVEYLVTVRIGRTMCKRTGMVQSSLSCPLQSKKLKKSLVCKSLIYTVPWLDYFELWNNSCLED
ncbi:PREDICTED: cystatin-like 1 [Chinchilla lanigera]|uniref:Cystatin like 1 n=1 Tax=Chinchilla lanigera TaxID=34839 RepID=A0A8C2VN82_CHILA|nr:PREDICTED: cystatin-like 1 [Chinchilla lanigera]